MQVSVTNLTQVTIPLDVSPFSIPANANALTLTVPDTQQQTFINLRNAGRITFTYVVLPNVPTNLATNAVGRTEVAGTTYTIQQSDYYCVIEFSQACTVTLPANLGRSFNCQLLQLGTGKVTWAAGTGAVIRVPGGTATGTASQYSTVNLLVRDNNGVTYNEWIVSGAIS